MNHHLHRPLIADEAPNTEVVVTATALTTGRVCAVVAEHVEPVTRFDVTDLCETIPEEIYSVPLELTLSQYVQFTTQQFRGTSRLPSGVTRVSNVYDFNDDIQSILDKAKQNAPKAMKAWANASAGSYRRLMPPSSTFLSAPGSVGYEYTCPTCNGTCQVSCHSCHGSGNCTCYDCSGTGKVNCRNCYGTTKITCTSCNGRGSWSEQVSQQVWDYGTSSYRTSYTTEYRHCSACYSSGRTSCYDCSYDGKISCFRCSGNGNVNCVACGATGKVGCSSCSASGIQYVWGTVHATVMQEESLSDTSEDETLKQLIHKKLLPEELPELGEICQVEHDVSASSVITRHKIRLDVRRATIRAHAHDFVIYGFGPIPRVLSFENIAGHLLTDDLIALETSVARASRWRPHQSDDLLDITADFLRSELNMLIAEKMTDLQVNQQDEGDGVADHFNGLVASDYSVRATNALRGALARLYGSELMEPAVYLCGITALLAGILFTLGWPEQGAWSAVFWSLIGATLIWMVLEWQTRQRIAKRFEHDLARRVLRQLAANGSVGRWRIGISVAAFLVVGLMISSVSQLPFVRNIQTEQRERTQSDQVLSQWATQSTSDFRMRNYPSRQMLDEKAQAGDARAQLILTWQLLLGAGGASKDVEAAGKWLSQPQTQATKDPLWQAARAVYILNQDAMPDAIRTAENDLDQAAKQGLVEASFWQARIYLEEHSPLHDMERGISLLTRAADNYHAHAALNLGQRLANGEGVSRDSAAARRYLQSASVAGLPEATAALAKLR